MPDTAHEPFDAPRGLRIVVTRFHGAGAVSVDFGAQVSWNIERAFMQFVEAKRDDPDFIDAGAVPGNFQIRTIPCLINSHTEARTFGIAVQADIVVWGQATASSNARMSGRAIGEKWGKAIREAVASGTTNVVINMGTGNQVSGAPERVNIVGVQVDAGTGGSFTTSLTVVPWDTLEAHAHSTRNASLADVARLDLPALALKKPLALFQVMVAVNAFRRGRHAAAARLFEGALKLPGFSGEHPDVQRMLGTSFLIAGQTQRGLQALERALERCAPGAERCQAMGLHNLGWAHNRLGDKAKALEYFNKALIRKAGDITGEATTLNNIGSVHDALGDKAKALEYYDKALPLRRKAGDIAGEATTLNNIGSVHDALGDKAKALEYYDKALPLIRKTGDIAREAGILNNIGSVHFALGDKAKALEYYDKALPLRRKAGDIAGEARTLNNIGVVHDALGDKAKAREYADKALPLQRKAGDIAGEATTLNTIGHVHSALGDKAKALECYDKALPLQRKAGDIAGEATTLNNIGRVHDVFGDKAKALEYYDKSLPLRRKAGDIAGEATTLNNIGRVHDDLGDKAKALEYYDKVLPLIHKTGDIAKEAATLNNIGGVHFALGDKAKALEYYDKSLPLRRKAGDIAGEAITHDNIALIHRKWGDCRRATVHFRNAARLYMVRLPPERGEAVASLELAIACCIQDKLLDEGKQVIKDMRDAGISELDVLAAETSLLSLRGGEKARSAYQKLALLGAGASEKARQDKLSIMAGAGIERARHGSVIETCRGIVILEVTPGSQAARAELRVGDILLKYNEKCIDSPTDLIAATTASAGGRSVSLLFWRAGAAHHIDLAGGKLGVAITGF